jgi:predicted Zn finger-like uncharacterized protein
MKTQCPNCKARFNVDDKFTGKQAKCPKCAKPFTIQPFTETPAAVESPATSPKPAVSPVKSPEPIAPPPKIATPTAPPAKSPAPMETPAKRAEPIVPPAKIASPAAPPVKSPEPVKPPPSTSSGQAAKIAEPVKEEKPESKAVSKALSKIVFVYCWMAVRIIAGVLGGLGLMLAIRKETHSTLIMTFAAADVFLLCSVAIELALFYKMWAAIADNQASVTPAKAVGFLFVPVFNIYWALCMVTGFSEDYNSFIQRRSIKAKDLSFTLFLIYAFVFILAATVVTIPMICVFAFVGLINRAFVGYTESAWALFAFVAVAGVGHFITYILFAIKTCNAINALPETKGR